MFPAVGAVRKRGTSVIFEDIAVPPDVLAPAALDLQALFRTHRYDDGIIFGHAKDGNLHFVISQSFNDEAAIRQYEAFNRDLVEMVVGKYDGSLKAEHGTGRNMAPFVEAEWGGAAFEIMVRVKSLVDPRRTPQPRRARQPRSRGAHQGSQVAARSRGGSRQVHRVRLLRVALPEPRSHADPAAADRRPPGDGAARRGRRGRSARPTSTMRSIPARPMVCAHWRARSRSTPAG